MNKKIKKEIWNGIINTSALPLAFIDIVKNIVTGRDEGFEITQDYCDKLYIKDKEEPLIESTAKKQTIIPPYNTYEKYLKWFSKQKYYLTELDEDSWNEIYKKRFKKKMREYCEMCGKEIEQDDYDYCDICPNCLDGE